LIASTLRSWARRCAATLIGPIGGALLIAVFSSSAVFAALDWGWRHLGDRKSEFWSIFLRYDGWHYFTIASEGYSYTAGEQSSLAFFPGFPLLGRIVSSLTGLDPACALLIVSNSAFVAFCCLMACYARLRAVRSATATDRADLPGLGLLPVLLIAVSPCSLFFRLAYSESLFLLVAATALWGIERRWHVLRVAGVVGAATAIRPVGVALLPVALLYAFQAARSGRVSRRVAIASGLLAGWGLAAYMLYQQLAFGDALIFAKTQDLWRIRPGLGFFEKGVRLAALEPIWNVYLPGASASWRNFGSASPWLNLQFANPLYWVATAALIVLGIWQNWLTVYESLLAVGLVLIPYITKGYDNGMLSQGRFMAVVFPAFLVLARLLRGAPLLARLLALAACGSLLLAYAALFAAGHAFF
jgi:hypothetical protein